MGAKGLEEWVLILGQSVKWLAERCSCRSSGGTGWEGACGPAMSHQVLWCLPPLSQGAISSSPVVSRSSMEIQWALLSLLPLPFQFSSPAPNATLCPEMELLNESRFLSKGRAIIEKNKNSNDEWKLRGEWTVSGSCFHSSSHPEAHINSLSG